MTGRSSLLGSRKDERAARTTLLAGALISALGLALVGIGQRDAGSTLSLAGVAITILGIHTFGRLGPEDDRPSKSDQRTTAVRTQRIAGLLLVAAGIVTMTGTKTSPGHTPGILLYVVGSLSMVAGAIVALQRLEERKGSKGKRGEVEKRSGLDKSPRP